MEAAEATKVPAGSALAVDREKFSQYITEKIKNHPNRELIEREVSYIADFKYIQDGKMIVEDVKGYKRGAAYQLFTIKRKLMLLKGIKVKET